MPFHNGAEPIHLKLNKLFKKHKALKSVLKVLAGLMVCYILLVIALGGFGKKKADLIPVINSDSTLLFAHRGIADGIPENSLQSLAQAKRMGFKAVEFDLRKSSTGDFVLFHDHDAQRMLGLDLEIENIPTADLGNYPYMMNGHRTSFHVPLLTNVLDQFHDDFIFYFDMKLSGFREADQIVEIIHRYGIEKSTIVASADLLTVFFIEYKHPGIITALEGYNAGKEWSYNLIPKRLKPDYLSGFFNRIDGNHLGWLKRKGLFSQRIVYGVDSSNFQSVKKLGIKNIILDCDSAGRILRPIPSLK